MVRFLLDNGSDALLFDAVHAKTCLHYAVLAGSVECCEVLLSDASLVRRRDGGGFCRLRDASVMDSQGYHRFVDVRSIYAFAALHLAACLDRVDVAQVLIQHGANMAVRRGAHKLGQHGAYGVRACCAPASGCVAGGWRGVGGRATQLSCLPCGADSLAARVAVHGCQLGAQGTPPRSHSPPTHPHPIPHPSIHTRSSCCCCW